MVWKKPKKNMPSAKTFRFNVYFKRISHHFHYLTRNGVKLNTFFILNKLLKDCGESRTKKNVKNLISV